MRKRLISCLLAAAMLLPAAAAGAESAPLVYRVRDGGENQIYLLGTIHVGNEDMYPLGDAVEQAYRESDILAVEADLYAIGGSLLSSLKYTFSLMYPLGDSAKNHLSPETYALGVEKLGMPEIALSRMKPVMWYSLAENMVYASAGLDATLGVDYKLLKRAHQDGKTICELEGMESQMNTLLALPEEVLDAELQALFSAPEETAEALKALAEAWRTGDEETLCAFLTFQGEEGLEEAYEDFSDALVEVRNEDFEKLARQYLENGEKALIAIGAGHIVGPDGLAQRLARAGYYVEKVGE